MLFSVVTRGSREVLVGTFGKVSMKMIHIETITCSTSIALRKTTDLCLVIRVSSPLKQIVTKKNLPGTKTPKQKYSMIIVSVKAKLWPISLIKAYMHNGK
jgi:hypothetical protein